jgi:hypothetical protein
MDTEIEALRRQKMDVLKEARETYRQWAANPDRASQGSLFSGRIGDLRAAVRVAESDLREFNAEHPRT